MPRIRTWASFLCFGVHKGEGWGGGADAVDGGEAGRQHCPPPVRLGVVGKAQPGDSNEAAESQRGRGRPRHQDPRWVVGVVNMRMPAPAAALPAHSRGACGRLMIGVRTSVSLTGSPAQATAGPQPWLAGVKEFYAAVSML